MTLSIITINYNNAAGLEKTIKSVISQTCKRYEFIIIDGGSKDGSKDIIEKYQDQITYWVSEPDNGIYNAMNKGVKVAKGEYCIFMNSGDIFVDNDVIRDVFNIGFIADIITGGIIINNNVVYYGPQKVSLAHFFTKSISHQASFIKTELLRKIPYDENLKIVSDWKFFIEAIVINKYSYKPINRLIGQMEPEGIGANLSLSEKEHIDVLHHLLPEYAFEDYISFIFGESEYDRFYKGVKNSRFKKMIYTANCIFFKVLLFWKKNSWVKKFPLTTKQ